MKIPQTPLERMRLVVEAERHKLKLLWEIGERCPTDEQVRTLYQFIYHIQRLTNQLGEHPEEKTEFTLEEMEKARDMIGH